jgi:hypothetical protein
MKEKHRCGCGQSWRQTFSNQCALRICRRKTTSLEVTEWRQEKDRERARSRQAVLQSLYETLARRRFSRPASHTSLLVTGMQNRAPIDTREAKCGTHSIAQIHAISNCVTLPIAYFPSPPLPFHILRLARGLCRSPLLTFARQF